MNIFHKGLYNYQVTTLCYQVLGVEMLSIGIAYINAGQVSLYQSHFYGHLVPCLTGLKHT